MRAWAGGASTLYMHSAFAFPSKKSSLQKSSDLYFLTLLHAREARGNPIPPYAALRAARLSASEKPLSLILESLLYSARTYFAKNSD